MTLEQTIGDHSLSIAALQQQMATLINRLPSERDHPGVQYKFVRTVAEREAAHRLTLKKLRGWRETDPYAGAPTDYRQPADRAHIWNSPITTHDLPPFVAPEVLTGAVDPVGVNRMLHNRVAAPGQPADVVLPAGVPAMPVETVVTPVQRVTLQSDLV